MGPFAGDGGGGASELAEGQAPLELVEVLAAAKCHRRFLLDGYERVGWHCVVRGGYTIDFGVRVLCPGGGGAGGSRVVAELERGKEFSGYLDLGSEHRDTVGGSGTPGQRPVLELGFDNAFSYFTAKTVELRLSKAGGAARDARSFDSALRASEREGDWERTVRLLGRMKDVGVTPTAANFAAAARACRAAGAWEGALALLSDMRSAGLSPDAATLGAAVDVCESCGQAEWALKLLDEMENLPEEATSPRDSLQGQRREDLQWIGSALAELLQRCPDAAEELRSQLLEAQGQLQKLTEAAQEVSDDRGL